MATTIVVYGENVIEVTADPAITLLDVQVAFGTHGAVFRVDTNSGRRRPVATMPEETITPLADGGELVFEPEDEQTGQRELEEAQQVEQLVASGLLDVMSRVKAATSATDATAAANTADEDAAAAPSTSNADGDIDGVAAASDAVGKQADTDAGAVLFDAVGTRPYEARPIEQSGFGIYAAGVYNPFNPMRLDDRPYALDNESYVL